MKLLDNKTITIPAGTASNPGNVLLAIPGEFFLCYSASAAFQLQLDNDDVVPCDAGFQIRNNPWSKITFLNPSAYPVTLTYYYGSRDASFTGTIQTRDVAVYAIAQVNGGHLDGTGYEILSAANYPQGMTVLGVNNGNRRKQIFFTAAGGNILVQTVAGKCFIRVVGGTSITLPGDSTYILKGDGGPVSVFVGELYYAS